MARFTRQPARTSTVAVRVTDEERQIIESLAERLGLGLSDVLRTALDFYVANAPTGKAVAKQSVGK